MTQLRFLFLILCAFLGVMALTSCDTGPRFDAKDWLVEQQVGGSVAITAERLEIRDTGGCTVWYRKKLQAPVRISYLARMIQGDLPANRVSDLNCFWMAQDPAHEGLSPVATPALRSGKFAEYDTLSCYYVGMGGNHNSSTRFRRYEGNGNRPLLPEHDLSSQEVLLEAEKDYLIEIESTAEGIRYSRDGIIIFDWKDPKPLTEGYFGFRTVWSHIQIRDFKVTKLD